MQACPCEGEREGRRVGEKNLRLRYSSRKVSALGGRLNRIHLAEESCISRNRLALGALLCFASAWSSPGNHGKLCGGSSRAAAGAVFPYPHQSSSSGQDIFKADSGVKADLVSAAEEHLE